jgi:hypothetical protein
MKKALLIGIDYIDISGIALRGCINDIINMRNMLIDAYDYEPENIIMLRDDDVKKFPSPTHDNIYDHIIDLVLDSGNLEELWLHYSGHGSQLQVTDCSLNPQTRGNVADVLVPLDYSSQGFITDTDLYDMIRRIKCRAILTFDCCHSGTICDLPWTIEYEVPPTRNVCRIEGMMVTTRVNNAVIKNPNIFMFSGCKDDQTSSDTINILDQRMGAFTNALCECLRKAHHNTSILSLYKDICIYLLNLDYKQTPILSTTVESPSYIICKKMPTFRHQYRHISNTKTPVELQRDLEISMLVNSADFEEINRGFLSIVSSSSPNPSVSTISNGTLSKLGRHFYRKLNAISPTFH